MASGKNPENNDTQENPSDMSNTYNKITPMIYDLIAAVQRGKETKLRSLITSAVNINETDHTGKHAFAHACSIGNLNFVQILHTSGSDINLPDNSNVTPIILAASGGHEAVVEYLCRAEADVNAQENCGTSALHVSVVKSVAVSTTLLKYGADINLKDKHNATPLHVSIRANNEETVKLLLAQGADLSIKDLDKRTPSKMAKHCGNTNIVKAITLAKYERKKFPSRYNAEKNSFPSKILSIFKPTRKKDLKVNIEENNANKCSQSMSTLKISDKVKCTSCIGSNKEPNEVALKKGMATLSYSNQEPEPHYSTLPNPRKKSVSLSKLTNLGTYVPHLAPDQDGLEQGASSQLHLGVQPIVVGRWMPQANEPFTPFTMPVSQLLPQHQSRTNSGSQTGTKNNSTLSTVTVSNNENYYSLPRRKMSVQPTHISQTMSSVSQQAIGSCLFSDLSQEHYSDSDLNMPTYGYSAPLITPRNNPQHFPGPRTASEANTYRLLGGIPGHSVAMESPPPLNYVFSPQSSYQMPGMYQVNEWPPRSHTDVHAAQSNTAMSPSHVQRLNTQSPELIPLRMHTESPYLLCTFQPHSQPLLGRFFNSTVLVPFTPQNQLAVHTVLPSEQEATVPYNVVTSSTQQLLDNQNDILPYINIQRQSSYYCLQQVNPVTRELPTSPQTPHTTSPLETSGTQHIVLSLQTPIPEDFTLPSIDKQREQIWPQPNEEHSENSPRQLTDSSSRDEDTDDYSVLPPAYQEYDDTSLKMSSDRSPPPLPPRPAKDPVSSTPRPAKDPVSSTPHHSLSSCHRSPGRHIGEIHKHLHNHKLNSKLSELNSSPKSSTREKFNIETSSTGSESGSKDLNFEEYFDDCCTYNNIRIEHNYVIQHAEMVAAGESSVSIQQQSSSTDFSLETDRLHSHSDSHFSSTAEASEESSEFEINQSLPSND